MAHLHFLQEEEKRVLAPYGCGVLQDQMLAGSRLDTLCAWAGGVIGALGMDVSGMDEVGRLLPAPTQLIPTRDPISEASLEEGLLPWLVLHLLSPGAPSGHQLLEDATAPSG